MLNPVDQVLTVVREHAASYMWEVDVDWIEAAVGRAAKAVRIEFSALFRLFGEEMADVGVRPSEGAGLTKSGFSAELRPFAHVFELTNLRVRFYKRTGF